MNDTNNFKVIKTFNFPVLNILNGLFANKSQLFEYLNHYAFKLVIESYGFICNQDFHLYLFEKVIISCGSYFNFQLEYDQFENYIFNIIGNSITFHKINSNSKYINKIFASIHLHQFPSLIFDSFIFILF